jgi:anion-transporting  ArsA/GET3 family ATPase
MLTQDLQEKRCVIVCGGGGVGKTTVAASLAIAATAQRDRVLVVTIDPAKRLAEAFGFTIEEMLAGGEPRKLNRERAMALGIREGAELSVGILNPKYILRQVIDQTLTPEQAEKLIHTQLYQQLSEMVYGLQEYTAYEWVTRMIKSGLYDLIILDTPPALHAKDFFNVPEKIRNLMESRVFQIFAPKKKGWIASIVSKASSFGFVEKLLGAGVFSESRLFFETFNLLRDRILERCAWLSEFFSDKAVAVVAVSTVESSAQLELEGLIKFMKSKSIPLSTVLINQLEQVRPVDAAFDRAVDQTSGELSGKWQQLALHQRERAERMDGLYAKASLHLRTTAGVEVKAIPMAYSSDGLVILRESAAAILG